MKFSRQSKWVFCSALVIPILLGIEHQHRARLLVGTWLTIEEGKVYKSSEARLYQIFRADGTGEEIFEWNGERGSAPFTYRLSGLWQLETIQDYAFYGTEAVPLNDSHLRNDKPLSRNNVFYISFSFDGKRMYFKKSKPDDTPEVYAKRVKLQPLPQSESVDLRTGS